MAKRVAFGALAFVVWLALFIGGKALILNGIGHNRPFVFCFALVLLIAYVACTRWIERRRPTELSAQTAGLAVAGAAAGLALFALVLGILALLGSYRFGEVVQGTLLGGAVASFAAAVGEEILFRGYIFRWIESVAGSWIAVAISALLFGGAHLLNRGATPGDAIAIAVEGGILLSAAYVYSRSLWLPIGIHFGWDFAGGGIFHASSVEGTPVAIIVCTIAGVAMLVAAQRAGRVRSAFHPVQRPEAVESATRL